MLKERLDIENVGIEGAHRAGRKSRNKPRTIVCKRFKVKQNILRKFLIKIIAKTLSGTERNYGKKLKFYEVKEK